MRSRVIDNAAGMDAVPAARGFLVASAATRLPRTEFNRSSLAVMLRPSPLQPAIGSEVPATLP